MQIPYICFDPFFIANMQFCIKIDQTNVLHIRVWLFVLILLFLSKLSINSWRITADYQLNFLNNQSDYEPVFFVNKTIKDMKMRIIGTSFFKKRFLNSNNKF